MFRASEFEFRHRVFVIFVIFTLGFGCSRIDRTIVVGRLAHAMGGNGLDLNSADGRFYLRMAGGLGVLIVLAAALIRTWATAYLKSDVVHDPLLRTEELVADGPYRHVRNPLYLGTILLTMGLGFLASRTGWIVLVGLMFVFTYRLILREEAELLSRQGEGYRAYCAKVRRLIPSIRPRVARGGLEPQWRQAIWGESVMWLFALGMVLLVVTLRFWMAGIVFAAGGVMSMVMPRGKGEKVELKEV